MQPKILRVTLAPIYLYLLAPVICFSQIEDTAKAAEKVFSEMSEEHSDYASKFDAFEIDQDSLKTMPMYEFVTDHRPQVNEVSEVYVGDRMIIQRFGELRDCVIPRVGWEDTVVGAQLHVEADKPVCKETKKSKKYTPTYVNQITSAGNEFVTPLKLTVRKDGTMKLCLSQMGISAGCKDELSEEELTVGPAFVSVEGRLQQTIEYLGKSGDELRFIYSEFKDRFARDSFNREFEVDFSEGNVVAFKGAVIEVLEATNATIKYRVIRHFQES